MGNMKEALRELNKRVESLEQKLTAEASVPETIEEDGPQENPSSLKNMLEERKSILIQVHENEIFSLNVNETRGINATGPAEIIIQHPGSKETDSQLEEAVEKTILDLTELIDVMKDQVYVNKLDDFSSIVTATSELYKAYKTYNQ
ncbi:hypothetical protein [Bacillus thuringiensis]|uniref:hypothetical protein n=1 Tax=Bacillus thuringiensis TaxID=1428 RepID=UPI000CD9CCA4|nr:hypothetical protein [Bacillus thuringiensis]